MTETEQSLTMGQELALVLLTDELYESKKPRSDAWTKEEDAVLMTALIDQHYLGNMPIKQVCEAVAMQLDGRNKGRCETRWHQKLKPLFETYMDQQGEMPVKVSNNEQPTATAGEAGQQTTQVIEPKVWTDETDKELADFILLVKKNGGKLAESLELFAERTGRSIDECRLRWDESVKPKYKQWIQQQVDLYRANNPDVNQRSAETAGATPGQGLSTESVIRFIIGQGVELDKLRAEHSKTQAQGKELDELRQRVAQLEGELSEEKLANRELTTKYEELDGYTNTLETNYKTFVGQLRDVANNDEFFGQRPTPVSLKMDPNGNLERTA